MKRSLIALASGYVLVTAAAAGVRVFVEASNGSVWLKYECSAAEVPRAFALDVSVDKGQIAGISNFFTGPCSATASGYGIFPAAFRDYVAATVTSGNSANWSVSGYNPLAAAADAPTDTLPGLGTSGVTLEFGALWDPALPATAPPASGTLCALQLSQDAMLQSAHVTVAANASRGGVVASPDGNAVAPTFTGAYVSPPQIPGAVSATTSTVTATTATVMADGTHTTITVTLNDGSGTPVPDKTVSLVRNGNTGSGTPVITPISATTSTAGVATFAVACTTVGVYDFQATGDGVLITQTASVTFAVTSGTIIPVVNGSFATPTPVWVGPGQIDYSPTWCDGIWAFTPAPWTATIDNNYGRVQVSGVSVHGPNPVFGPWMANLADPGRAITQNLHTTVNAGDTLAVTFSALRDSSGSGVLQASLLVGSTAYSQTFDTSTQTVNTWTPLTLAQTIPTGVSGNLSLKFNNVSGRAWLTNVGNISVTPAPVLASYATWAATNSVTGGVSGNSSNGGVQNGIAYFLNTTGTATQPGVSGNTVTWTNGGNIPSSAYAIQFVVQTSTDLVNWTPVDGSDQNLSNTPGAVSYTLPPGLGQTFVRLVVTPN